MQKDDKSIQLILENKQEGRKPVLEEIDKTNFVVKSLWYQWENLEVKNDILYADGETTRAIPYFNWLYQKTCGG